MLEMWWKAEEKWEEEKVALTFVYGCSMEKKGGKLATGFSLLGCIFPNRMQG